MITRLGRWSVRRQHNASAFNTWKASHDIFRRTTDSVHLGSLCRVRCFDHKADDTTFNMKCAYHVLRDEVGATRQRESR